MVDTPGLNMSLELPKPQTSFDFSATPPSNSFPPAGYSSFDTQRKNEESLISGPAQVVSTSVKLESLSFTRNLCPLCKGKKYGFSAYFHNLKIFPEPPHAILPLVEESYMLRDRLKSLLVTYAMREVEQGQDVMAQVHHWEFSVGALTDEVMNSASNSGFVLNLGRLDDVRKWLTNIVDEFGYYVSCQAHMKLSRMRLAELMIEYRRIWEFVWIGYLQDRKAIQAETM